MASTTLTNPTLVRRGINKIFEQFQTDNPAIYPKFVNSQIMDCKEAFERYMGVSNLGLLQATPEGDAVTIDNIKSPFSLDVYPEAFRLGYSVTKQLLASDVYKKINKGAEMLALSRQQTREVKAHSVLNLGFATPAAGGPQTLDNVALFSNAHPRSNGTTDTNVPSTATALSYTSLSNAMAAVGRQKQWRDGIPNIYTGDFILLVSPENVFTAKTLADSVDRPDTSDRAKNVIANRIQVVVSPWLTDPNNWFLLPTKKSPIMLMERIKWTIEHYYDESRWVDTVQGGEEIKFFAAEWLNTYGVAV